MKKKSDVFAKTVPLDILRCGVLLLVGTDFGELRKAFKAVTRGCKFDNSQDGYFDNIVKMIESDRSGFKGICFSPANDPDKVIYLPEMDELTLLHEIVHAVDFVFDDKGIKDGEIRAYSVEYLFGKFTNRI